MPTQTNLVMKAMNKMVTNLTKQLGTKLPENLREATPKDTTYASVNWVPQAGTPFEGTAGTRAAAEAGSIDVVTQQTAINVLATTYRLSNGVINVTNNTDYIDGLNDGTNFTAKAPVAFVQTAIATTIRQVLTL